MTEDQARNKDFQVIVLAALWLVIMGVCGKKIRYSSINVRSNMLAFGDMYGLQHDEAKAYRREKTFPEILGD